MDWNLVRALRRRTLHTITGEAFLVDEVMARMVYVVVGPQRRRHSISRTNLERAVALIQAGKPLSSPVEYTERVADERPSYAWAILRELGYIEA